MSANQSLKEFLSAYFHQDWALDAQPWSDVVAQFFRDHELVTDLVPIAQALRLLIDTNEPDELLSARLFREFGSYFDPRGIGQSTRGWLTALTKEFDREIARRG